MNDPMVRRVNALVTTFLDLLATLLFAAAAGWAALTYLEQWWAAAVAAAIVIVLVSAYAQHRATVPAPVPVAVDDDGAAEVLPGPGHPGNVHVMGR